MNDYEREEISKQVKGLHELLEVLLANMEDEYGAEEEEE